MVRDRVAQILVERNRGWRVADQCRFSNVAGRIRRARRFFARARSVQCDAGTVAGFPCPSEVCRGDRPKTQPLRGWEFRWRFRPAFARSFPGVSFFAPRPMRPRRAIDCARPRARYGEDDHRWLELVRATPAKARRWRVADVLR